MRVKELIELLKDYPEDMTITIQDEKGYYDGLSPMGLNVKNINLIDDPQFILWDECNEGDIGSVTVLNVSNRPRSLLKRAI